MADGPVRFLDLRSIVGADVEIADAVARVVRSGQYIGGAEVARFEASWAAYCGATHAVGVGNGLDALTLALQALGIGPGDEVIVPSWTFVATWLAVSRCGATVVPVEVDPSTANIDPGLVQTALTARTRAVICVHLYGQPANVPALQTVLEGHHAVLIEDAAQAHGASLHGVVAGGLTDLAAFSFYPGKNLGALGDGGAVTCTDPSVATRVRRLGNYGSERKYEHLERGGNSRLDPIQAAALGARLPRLAAQNDARRGIAAAYLDAFEPLGWLEVPRVIDGAVPAWHLFVVRCADRDGLALHLAHAGVETGLHYPVANHRSPAYSGEGFVLPVADELAQRSLSLPIGPHLTEGDIERVVAAVVGAR